MAKHNCKPNPHSTVFKRMAFRSVEKIYASPSMVASPKTPANLPILYTHSPRCERRANFYDRVENASRCSKLYTPELYAPDFTPPMIRRINGRGACPPQS